MLGFTLASTMAVLITHVEYSEWVVSKLNQKHRCSIDDVFDILEDENSAAAWEEDPEHGRRLLVRGRTQAGRTLRVVLYPVDEGAGRFRLGTAF